MLSTLSVNNPSTLRRILFASSTLSSQVPKRWEIIAKFASRGNEGVTLSPREVEIITDNSKFMDDQADVGDESLLQELVHMPFGERECLGIILVSQLSTCVKCGGSLLLRSDRPSNLFLYTQSHGTLPAVQYSKYCTRKKCSLVQHYGYHTHGTMGQLYYDKEWAALAYFVSSQETAFEQKMLFNFDHELLIGQINYKQKAEIYNAIHGYGCIKKQCSSLKLTTNAQNSRYTPVGNMYMYYAWLLTNLCEFKSLAIIIATNYFHINYGYSILYTLSILTPCK